jgi:phage-related protein
MFYLEFYETADGKKPAEEFMVGLDNKMRTKAIHELMLLREKGNALREPFSKSLGDGILELRVQQGNDSSRIFYFFFAGTKIILMNGFIKKTRKTPPAELERARQYKKDYERRHHGRS